MSKSKIADEEIRKYISEGLSNALIAKALGVKQPNINARVNKLRKEYGEMLPDPEQTAEQKQDPVQEQPETEKPFPFEPKEQVRFGGRLHTVRHVGQNRMIMYENATMKGVTIMLDDYNAGRIEIVKINEKPPIKTAGEDMALKRRREDEEPESPKAPGTIFERVAARKADLKPATVNQDFEECFKPINKEKMKQSVEDLFQADPAESAIESTAKNVEPVHIDLEIENSTDPVNLPTVSPEDYDPEWFDKPIPRKGTVERVIWDRAYREISEIQTLRVTIQTALSHGDRLPTVYVDKYNKYVSKYSEEVCV